jgi:Domain of unknown function (DUF4160)
MGHSRSVPRLQPGPRRIPPAVWPSARRDGFTAVVHDASGAIARRRIAVRVGHAPWENRPRALGRSLGRPGRIGHYVGRCRISDRSICSSWVFSALRAAMHRRESCARRRRWRREHSRECLDVSTPRGCWRSGPSASSGSRPPRGSCCRSLSSLSGRCAGFPGRRSSARGRAPPWRSRVSRSVDQRSPSSCISATTRHHTSTLYAGRVRHPGVQTARFSIDTGELIDGELPSAKLATATSWCERHREALRADWQRAQLHLHPAGRYDQQ